MTPEIDRLFVDDVMATLIAAEAHVNSLEADVLVRDEMIAVLLTEVQSQIAQVHRLMWRLRQGQESRRG